MNSNRPSAPVRAVCPDSTSVTRASATGRLVFASTTEPRIDGFGDDGAVWTVAAIAIAHATTTGVTRPPPDPDLVERYRVPEGSTGLLRLGAHPSRTPGRLRHSVRAMPRARSDESTC